MNIEKEKVDTSYVMVDGSGVGDIGEVVLHDRQLLSGDGMFVIAININRKTQELVGDIQIASRGFIYVKDNFRLINDSKRIVKEVFLKKISKDHKTDLNKISKDVRKSVGAYLFQKTQKKPMVLPMFMRI